MVILWLKLTHVNEVFRMFTTVLADWIDWMLACLVSHCMDVHACMHMHTIDDPLYLTRTLKNS